MNPEVHFGIPFETHTLAVNYRSPANIVSASQALIAHNQRRVQKETRAHRRDDATIVVHKTNSLAETLEYIYRIVQQEVGRGQSPGRVAIIGRKRGQLIPFQIYFASREVPFCAAEDLQVFLSDAFERLLELLIIKQRAQQLATRAQVVEDLLTLCNLVKRYPLKKSDRETLRRHLQQRAGSTLQSAVDALVVYHGPLKGANTNGTTSAAFAEAIRSLLDAGSITAALNALGTSFEGLHLDLGKAEDDVFVADPPFAQLAEYAASYGDGYNQFLIDIEEAKSQLAYIPPFEEDAEVGAADSFWKHPLHLMTALRAKGKEFDTVILLDVNDGIWPNRSAKTPAELEAERRVFYVAYTRARSKLVLHASTRIGNRQIVDSPYLSELGLAVAT